LIHVKKKILENEHVNMHVPFRLHNSTAHLSKCIAAFSKFWNPVKLIMLKI